MTILMSFYKKRYFSYALFFKWSLWSFEQLGTMTDICNKNHWGRVPSYVSIPPYFRTFHFCSNFAMQPDVRHGEINSPGHNVCNLIVKLISFRIYVEIFMHNFIQTRHTSFTPSKTNILWCTYMNLIKEI